MKRYALFAFPDYYPSGGMNDLVKTSDDIEELKASVSVHPRIPTWIAVEGSREGAFGGADGANAEIYDLDTMNLVLSFEEGTWR